MDPMKWPFSCERFWVGRADVGLAKNTHQIGIMDEETRTTLNLKECIRQAKSPRVFHQYRLLDRTW